MRLFSVDLDASQIARLTGLGRNAINRYLKAIRQRLADYCAAQSPFPGKVDVDESFLGARNIKGKGDHGGYGKTIVFGIFQRNGHVYTEIVPNCSKATLQAVIRGRVQLESVIYSDGWRDYNGLVNFGWASTCASIMAGTNLLKVERTSTVLKVSGATPRPVWFASEE